MPLFLLFLIIPMVEIALFIQVGGLIGLWPTLLIVVLTAVLGSTLLRQQGALALSSLQQRINSLQDPSEPLAHGGMILFAGALLLTPGFFTDAVGLALMVPGFRSMAYRRAANWLKSRGTVMTSFSGGPSDIVDGEFQELEPSQRPTHRPSEWTKH